MVAVTMDHDMMLVEEMKHFGLTQYESIAYLKLLEDYPLNGYLLSKKSGVPRSRIYEVIDHLIEKGMIFERKEENASVYYPLEPKLFLSNVREDYAKRFNHVEEETKKRYHRHAKPYEHKIIVGKTKIFSVMNALIRTAEKRIDVSIWEEEFEVLAEEFRQAIERGARVKGIYFGHHNPFAEVLTHRRISTYLQEKAERYIIIVIDDKEAVTGIISRGEESQLSWTNDIGVIDITKDYIVHDLMVNGYSDDLDEDARAEYEAKLDKIRAKYYEL